MIVHDLDVFGAFNRPAEANSILVIYPDAMLAFAFALQDFQAIAGRRAQKIQSLRRIKLRQFPDGTVCDAGKPSAFSSFEQGLRIPAGEALDHGNENITNNVKRQDCARAQKPRQKWFS